MSNSSNPLRQFFRQPSIYVRLPSQGKHWAPGSLEIPTNGEIPVYPMTAIDEITYRTPDALFNGQAVVSVIQSCMPNIKDAWAMPSVDLDTILVAIRIASYGHEVNVSTVCPNCNTEGEYVIDLRSVLGNLTAGDYSQPIQKAGLEVHIKPLNYKQLTENSMKQFEEQKVLNILPETDIDEATKIKRLHEAVHKLTELTIQTLCQCILMIKTQDAMVTEPEFILEFLQNCDKNVFNYIRDYVAALRDQGDIKPMNLTCQSCQHQYTQRLELDQASFFVDAS